MSRRVNATVILLLILPSNLSIQRLIAPDGTYRYEIHAVDMAGNEAEPARGIITVES